MQELDPRPLKGQAMPMPEGGQPLAFSSINVTTGMTGIPATGGYGNKRAAQPFSGCGYLGGQQRGCVRVWELDTWKS